MEALIYDSEFPSLGLCALYGTAGWQICPAGARAIIKRFHVQCYVTRLYEIDNYILGCLADSYCFLTQLEKEPF